MTRFWHFRFSLVTISSELKTAPALWVVCSLCCAWLCQDVLLDFKGLERSHRSIPPFFACGQFADWFDCFWIVFTLGTNTLAGAVCSLDQCVRNFREFTHCSIVEAVEAASLHPAQVRLGFCSLVHHTYTWWRRADQSLPDHPCHANFRAIPAFGVESRSKFDLGRPFIKGTQNKASHL